VRFDIDGRGRRNRIGRGIIRVIGRIRIRPVITRIPIRKTEIETESRRRGHTPVTAPVREPFSAIYR
jgi:hypothetical protein